MPKFFFSSDMSAGGSDKSEIVSMLKSLEERVAKLEAAFNGNGLSVHEAETELRTLKDEVDSTNDELGEYTDREEKLEYQIGQFWFAKVGIIAVAIGIAFFLTFPYKNFPAALPGIIGCFLACIFFVSSSKTRKNLEYLSGYLLGGGMTLLYFTTMRLYFFGHRNLIAELTPEIFLLSLIAVLDLIISIRKKSVYLAALSLMLGYTTAIISDNSYFIFSAVVLLSALTVYLKIRYGWDNLIFWGIALTYFTHFIWFINNPLMGKEIKTITSPQINLIFLLLYTVIFSSGNLFRKDEKEKFSVILSSALNAFLGYGLFSLITASLEREYIFDYHFMASVVFLSAAIAFWLREKSRYSTFIYAMLGYLALSTAIIAEFKSPDLFILLCWQSLLVVSTAVWFRSKFIVVANFVIYVIIFIAYLVVEGKVDLISISFGIVALMSARILNWKKRSARIEN